MEVSIFYDILEKGYVENLSVLVFLKWENFFLTPSSNDAVKLILNSVFFLSAIDELVNILRVFVEFKIIEVTKAELRVHMINICAYNIIKTLPVPGFHVAWIMQLRNKRSDGIHNLFSFFKSLECLVVLNVFILWKFSAS